MPKGKNEEIVGLLKDELKIMLKLVGLRSKINYDLIDDDGGDKKNKKCKNMCHKKET